MESIVDSFGIYFIFGLSKIDIHASVRTYL